MTIESPHRADHSYTQHLEGTPDQIFPLLCPVREVEWVKGWEPEKVISASGVAEAGCVFTTVDEYGTSTWFVSAYHPETHRVEFVKFTPGYFTVFIAIQLAPSGPGTSTAEVRYQYTATDPAGRDAVSAFTSSKYESFMKAWESELNDFLRSGRNVND